MPNQPKIAGKVLDRGEVPIHVYVFIVFVLIEFLFIHCYYVYAFFL